MNTHSSTHLFILLLQVFYHIHTSNFEFTAPSNACSENIVIYHQTTPLTPNFSSTIIYSISFPEIPDLVYATSGYQGEDQLFKEYYLILLKDVDLTNFMIELNISNPTNIIFLKINYFAIDDTFEAIEPVHHLFQNFNTISLPNTKNKLQTLTLDPQLSNIDYTWIVVHFLNGFYMKSVTGIDLNLSNIHINTMKNIEIQARVLTDANFQAIYLHFLLIRPKYMDYNDQLRTSNYEYNIAIAEYQNSDPTHPINYNLEGNYLIGLIGFANFVPSTKLEYEWTSEKVNDYYEARVEFNDPMHLYQFSYFYLIQIICTNSYYWDPYVKNCIAQCPESYTQNPHNNICEVCDDQCLSCSTDPYTCTSCNDQQGYQLIEQECLLPPKQPEQPQTQQINTIYFAFLSLALVPIGIVILCLVCKKKNSISVQDRRRIRQHPSIEV